MFLPSLSLIRACAGPNHVLLEATGDGHGALPVELPKDEAGNVVGVGLRCCALGNSNGTKFRRRKTHPMRKLPRSSK